MRRRILLMSMLCVLPLSERNSSAANPTAGATWHDSAKAALLVALHDEHPEMQQWSVEAQLSERQRERLAEVAPTQIEVTQVGARSAVRLEWRVNGQRSRTTVWFVVRGVRPMLVARKLIHAGASLQPGDASVLERDAMVLACRPLVDEESLSGMRSRLLLHEGTVICTDAVEPKPPVSRGEEVKVKFVSGRVAISSKAVAQADGQVGSVVKVRNPSSGMSYLAEVIGEREVTVHE